MPGSKPLRVLVADDHPPTRDEICRALTAEHGFVICAAVSDAAAAVHSAASEHPDVCLLDVRMPGGGVAAAWEISARLPDTKIVMLTVSDIDADLFSALRAGAHGYLLKTMNFDRLPHAVRGVVSGEAAMPRPLVSRILERFHGSDPRRRRLVALEAVTARLTSREWEVIDLVSRNHSTSDIARELHLSKSAVRVHIAAAVRKLGAENRQAAVARFRGRSDI